MEPIKNQKTPLMQQYWSIKQQCPDALLLFQVGDFYELFYDDAKKAAACLAIALTTRGKDDLEPIPLCGVPVHALDYYLTKLIKAGFNVALCNQLEPATPGKVVARGIVQVLTPGTLTDSKLLDDKQASYLFSFFPLQDQWGLVFSELLTAQLFATFLPIDSHKNLEIELSRFLPDEIVIPSNTMGASFAAYFKKLGYVVSNVSFYEHDKEAQEWLMKQFKSETCTLLQKQPALLHALVNFYGYLKNNQFTSLDQFKQIQFYKPDDYLILDKTTQRNLELIKNLQDGLRTHTLYSVLDKSVTAMGSRTICKWIMRPLVQKELIVARQDAIDLLINSIALNQSLKKLLHEIGDIERVVGRIGLMRAHVYDYQALLKTLTIIPHLKLLLMNAPSSLLHAIMQQLGDFSLLHQLLHAAINQDTSKDWIINGGFDHNLDHIRLLIDNAHEHIIQLEQREQQKTGITSLKIRYTHLHGYYIEVTKTHLSSIPSTYERVQSLAGKERFTTQELKQLQADIMNAQQNVTRLEKEIFDHIKQQVHTYASSLRKMAHALAHLDALLGLSCCAYEYGYKRPEISDNYEIKIEGGKHPVLEQVVGQRFIPNDTLLNEQQSLLIITGPNMGGKSTYLRQTALVTLMAHIGSFVPVEYARIALCDRIFTRIGASDNVAGGKSTFLMEMEETATICAHATQRSLIILDEVGRGTSTFDGLALAQAVLEYIYVTLKAKCLFATHYHELTALHKTYPSIVPYYAVSKKTVDGIMFLHTISRGIADGSFGLEVAKLARLPSGVIARAQEILIDLDHYGPTMNKDGNKEYEVALLKKQLQHLEEYLKKYDELGKLLQSLDYDNLSPKKAFDFLWQLKS